MTNLFYKSTITESKTSNNTIYQFEQTETDPHTNITNNKNKATQAIRAHSKKTSTLTMK